MNASRTTLSFLDLALMLLSAFAYAHFVNLADPESDKKLSDETAQASAILAEFEYKVTDFFGDSSAVLTNHARREIAKIPNVRKNQTLTIYVPAITQKESGQRLRQWEKVAARSAAIADAFEKAGQDGERIVLKMPEKLLSKTTEKQNILLTFQSPENSGLGK
ncbi:hypothetical protein AB1K62_01325 [Parasphingorhabdus sp. JC815]|uniref:hypothetical protein n=1 Tax=Parasphingorhabdus sp. JC815 TaxID=3232140 RepID=UPI003458B9EC